MSVQIGVSEHVVTFYGGRISVATGTGTTRRGTEGNIKTPFMGFQEIIDPQTIGSDVAKDAPEYLPRLYFFFRKKESVDVVIKGLERCKELFAQIEEQEKSMLALQNAAKEINIELAQKMAEDEEMVKKTDKKKKSAKKVK